MVYVGGRVRIKATGAVARITDSNGHACKASGTWHHSDDVELLDETFHITSLSGDVATVQAPLSMEISRFKAKVRSEMGLSPDEAIRLAVGQTMLVPESMTLAECQAANGARWMLESTVNVTAILGLLRVTRHVYNGRGGAPPHRGSYLTATDDIELDASMTMEEQMHKLVPNDGMGPAGRLGPRPHLVVVRVQDAPKRWQDLEQQKGVNVFPVDGAQIAGDLFDSHDKALVVLVPMRGMD
eukprot:TRINITY_DN8447_c0_g1_i2.p2 TRINITY_DN8447_c0_g1~~TRINITY_DN8447_c0_g1_i2.p2  ORF type:complete len:241 (+),score=38.52 TRINITY_DN8447_c0_g1_i2:913-1635(+)